MKEKPYKVVTELVEATLQLWDYITEISDNLRPSEIEAVILFNEAVRQGGLVFDSEIHGGKIHVHYSNITTVKVMPSTMKRNDYFLQMNTVPGFKYTYVFPNEALAQGAKLLLLDALERFYQTPAPRVISRSTQRI